MRRKFGLTIFLLGSLLILSAVVVSASNETPLPAAPIAQTSPEGATYVGATTCFGCHSQYYRNWDMTLHSEMVKGSEASVADFAAGGAPIALEDVTFVLGNKYNQRFVQQTADGYTVLPGIWHIQTQEWIEAEEQDWLADCAGCHTTGFQADAAADAAWSELNITCEACHGPGSAHVEAASALPEGVDPMSEEVLAVRQTIVSTVDSQVCGQCHSQGTSADGAHPYPVGHQVGAPLEESFSLVQHAEGEDSEIFWPDGTEKAYRATYNAYLTSAHANALPTITENDHAGEFCLDCHSTDFSQQDTTFPEGIVTMETAAFGITCVQCHAPHEGTAVREAQLRFEAYDLCVSCHTGTDIGNNPIRVGDEVHHPMREMFEGISFLNLDPNPGPHFANEAYGPICSSCHMVPTTVSPLVGATASHTFDIVLPTEAAEGQADSCTGCHSLERSEDNTPENLTFFVEEVQEDTQERVESLNEDLEEITAANPDWDPEAEDKPEEQLLAERIHTLVSFVEADGSWGFHNPGYADDILSEAEDLMDELLDMVEE